MYQFSNQLYTDVRIEETFDTKISFKKEKLQEQKSVLNKFKLSHAVSPLENPSQIKVVRRTIARINTELRKRVLQA